jgi:hypothetical protein
MGERSLTDTVAGVIVAALVVIAASVGIYAFSSGRLDRQEQMSVDLRPVPARAS